jgi:hypothetical protein
MKKFLFIAALLAEGSALAQGLAPLRLKETAGDFPRNQL